MSSMKKCPFRKETWFIDKKRNYDDSVLTKVSTEEFLPCIGEECMAYAQLGSGTYATTWAQCKLMPKGL